MIQRADLLQENDQTKNNNERRRNLNALLTSGAVNPDLTQFAVGVPEKPEFDNDRAKQFQNLSKAAMIAQGIDALTNAVGFARTQGKSNEMRPVSSPVGELGIHSYNNLMGMEQAHRDQLNNWRDNVLDANKHNTGLAMQTMQNQADMTKSAIEQELKHISEMERQGRMSDREARLERGRLQRSLIQQGLTMDREGNVVPLSADGAEEQGFKPSPQQEAMFKSFLKYSDDASPEDYDFTSSGGRNVRPGTPSWHRDRLIDKLGDDFYLMMNQHRDSQSSEPTSYDPYTDPVTQRNAKAANRTQQQMLMQNVVNAPDPQTRNRAASEWYAMTVRELQRRGDVNEQEIPQIAEQLFARHLSELGQTPQQPAQPQMAGMVSNQESQPPQQPAQQQQTGGVSTPQPEQAAQPQRGRSVVPSHLRVTFDAGDKLMQQINLMERIKQTNPNFDASVGQKRLDNLLKQYKDQLNRLSQADRQKVIEAVGYNPFEEQQTEN